MCFLRRSCYVSFQVYKASQRGTIDKDVDKIKMYLLSTWIGLVFCFYLFFSLLDQVHLKESAVSSERGEDGGV